MTTLHRIVSGSLAAPDGHIPALGEAVTIRFDDWIEGAHEITGVVDGYQMDGEPGACRHAAEHADVTAVRVAVRAGLTLVVPLAREARP